jgi:hypothetical protein
LRKLSNSFILALRLHHSALEIMYTDPDFTYLLLITALEAISSIVYEDYKLETGIQYLVQDTLDGKRYQMLCRLN